MKRFIACIAVVVLFAACPPAFAEDQVSGADLQRMCNSRYDTDYGYCAGYIKAVADIMREQRVAGLDACGHDPIRSQQLIDIVNNYLEKHENELHLSARELIARALNAGFSCTR